MRNKCEGQLSQIVRKSFACLGVVDSKSFFKLMKQFLKFSLVGVSNTAVSMGTYYLFLLYDPNLYMLGNILGTILSIANAFLWNELLVFTEKSKSKKNILLRLGKTYISYGVTSVLANIILWIEVGLLQISKVVAPIVNLFITIPLNFIINKLWTFR